MRGKKFFIGLRVPLAIFTVTLLVTSIWAATNEKVLHTFNGTDGFHPYAGLISDAAGNLYGTTGGGGTYDYGTVFELTPTAGGDWTEKVLHSFSRNGTDGAYPEASLISDAAGNLYGTTSEGGTYDYGTVFELTPTAGGDWTEKVLHNFNSNGTDGYYPNAALISDAAGNLYSTTTVGGTYPCNGFGCGTVFELTPTAGGGWTEKVLHNFNGTDGYSPFAGLIVDAAGNLYSTTPGGGTYGYGTVLELMRSPHAAGGSWTEQVLYNLNGTDGSGPFGGLIFDAAGNLYGTTGGDGTYDYGTVFELTPAAGGRWAEQVLHNFNGTDGDYPFVGLIVDAAGNLCGTTAVGGTYGDGTVFELTRSPHAAGGSWTEQVLHNFNNAGTDGYNPYASLISDAAGNLYGTNAYGGRGGGTVFEITH